jgi:hypothetical protein
MAEPRYVEAAFMVMLTPEGFWEVTSDLSMEIDARRAVERHEIRIGCSEIANVIGQHDLASLIASSLAPKSADNSQQVAAKMRDAISRRKSDN